FGGAPLACDVNVRSRPRLRPTPPNARKDARPHHGRRAAPLQTSRNRRRGLQKNPAQQKELRFWPLRFPRQESPIPFLRARVPLSTLVCAASRLAAARQA